MDVRAGEIVPFLGRKDSRRGGAGRLQTDRSALHIADEPAPGVSDGLCAGSGVGEGAGREPGRSAAQALLRTAPVVQDGGRSQRLWLADKSVVYAKAQILPEQTERTVFEIFEAERAVLMPYRCLRRIAVGRRRQRRRDPQCASATTTGRTGGADPDAGLAFHRAIALPRLNCSRIIGRCLA